MKGNEAWDEYYGHAGNLVLQRHFHTAYADLETFSLFLDIAHLLLITWSHCKMDGTDGPDRAKRV